MDVELVIWPGFGGGGVGFRMVENMYIREASER
jgi:hypothetical protein